MLKENRQHWLIIMMLCGLTAGSIGICSNSIGVFYTPVSEELQVMRGTFAFHATLSLIATAVTTLFVPQIMRRYSLKMILGAGTLIASLSTAGMAFCNSMMQFYILGFTRGVGAALFASYPVTMIINHWFKAKHGLATSIALSFSGLAGAVCAPFYTSCIEKYGWRTAYLIMAAMIVVLAVPALLGPLTVKPSERGLKALGEGMETEVKKPAMTKTEKKFSRLSIGFFCLCWMTMMHTSITGVSQHLSGYAVAAGLTASFGAMMMSLSMMGNVLTKLAIGILSDRFKPVKACIIMMAFNAMALLGLLFGSKIGSQAVLTVSALCYGSVYSVGAVGIPLLVRYFYGTENYSRAYPIVSFMTSLGSSLSLTLIGYVYDFTGSYDYALMAGVVIHLVNFVLLGIAAKRRITKD